MDLEKREKELKSEFGNLEEERERLNQEAKKINQRLAQIRERQLQIDGAHSEVVVLKDAEKKAKKDKPKKK